MVNVTRKSPISGRVHTLALNISQEAYDIACAKWNSGTMIQDAFPMLDANEREFLMTGITPEEWAKIFSKV